MFAPEIPAPGELAEDEVTAVLRAEVIEADHVVAYYADLEAKVQAQLARARGRAAEARLALEVPR